MVKKEISGFKRTAIFITILKSVGLLDGLQSAGRLSGAESKWSHLYVL